MTCFSLKIHKDPANIHFYTFMEYANPKLKLNIYIKQFYLRFPCIDKQKVFVLVCPSAHLVLHCELIYYDFWKSVGCRV